MEFKDRLKLFIDICYNGNITQYAGRMGLPPSTVIRWVEGGSSPKVSSLEGIENTGISLVWLITGRGSIFSYTESGMELSHDPMVRGTIKKIFSTQFKNFELDKHKIDFEKNVTFEEVLKVFNEVNPILSDLLFQYHLTFFSDAFQAPIAHLNIVNMGESSDFLQRYPAITNHLEPYIQYGIALLAHLIGPDLNNFVHPSTIYNKIATKQLVVMKG